MRPVSYYADHSKPKPYFRGVSHQYGFFVSIVLAIYLLYITPMESMIPIVLYCIGFCGMLGTSSSYHRLKWTVAEEVWVRRLDYVMISVMIAGCFTPFCWLAFESAYSSFVLWALWGGVAFCVFLNLVWVDSPKVFRTSVYIALGWIGLPLFPEMLETCGWTCTTLVAIEGILHTAGGLIYAFQTFDPLPEVFGYHEIFHACVLLAAFIHYYAIITFIV